MQRYAQRKTAQKDDTLLTFFASIFNSFELIKVSVTIFDFEKNNHI